MLHDNSAEEMLRVSVSAIKLSSNNSVASLVRSNGSSKKWKDVDDNSEHGALQ